MRRVLSALCCAALVSGIGVWRPVQAVAAPVDVGLFAADEQQALAEAAGRQASVVVESQTTEHSQLAANPDGSFTLTTSREPVRVNQNGKWRPIDTTVKPTWGGFEAAATLLDATYSAGGSGPLVTIETADGTVSLHVPFELPRPIASGSTLVYPNVVPDVDIQIDVQAESFTEVVVIKTPQAAANPLIEDLRVTVTTRGLILDVADDGSSTVTTAAGDPVFYSPPPTMWDSKHHAQAGPKPDARTRAPHTPELDRRVQTASPAGTVQRPTGRTDITLGIPDEVLADATYPIFMDPSFAAPTINYLTVWSYGGTDFNIPDYKLKVGNCGWPECVNRGEMTRSYISVNASHLRSRTLNSGEVAYAQVGSVRFLV